MWLEIIITLLLGGLFYILVGQRNSKHTKRFRVTNRKRDRTVLLKYTSFESFSEKCRDQFNFSKKEKLCFASDEVENLELDEECLVDLEDKSLLIAKGETARHNDDDHDDHDENDDSLGFESHGSDSFTGDTIVDHGDMKKSEDIQPGIAKFDLGKNEKLHFASGEDDNIELDEKCLVDLEDKSLLIVKGMTSGPSDVDDADNENDDWLECLGSDSCTGDTVVDNADMRKWEAIQSGSKVKEHIIKYGLKNITSVLKENVDAWKCKPLNIAVTGESGKGKSSFINAFQGMYPGQEGAANVDEEECTTDCRAFRHPKYDSFVLWDVPGVGTTKFPKEKYLNAIQFDRYDFFMIISSTRFSELDSWLAKEILRKKKRFYFIRTKIDIDMSEKEKRFRKSGQQFHEKEEFDKLKSKISEKLYCDFQIENLPFFMISNHHPNKYDFPLILDQLLQDVPAEKKDAMLFGLSGMSQTMLEEKASALKSRIWKVALLSGAGAAIPIPFVSRRIESAVIHTEVLFYREQFGLDDQSLKQLADMGDIPLEHLKESVKFRTPADLWTVTGLNNYLMKYTEAENAVTIAKFTIPVIGVPFFCGMSFATTMGFLESLLESMKQDALKALVYVTTGKTETD